MPPKRSSQWDFGELFPPEQTRRVLSVSELTGQVRRLIEKQVGQVWVSGEITNLRIQSSGHCYFTLKDAAAQLNCVLFRGESRASRQLLADGRNVLLQGELTVYEARGQYQLIVATVESQGLGALQQAFERLKQRLQAEGLFAPERKRLLPRFPSRLGVVTSATGAALRDVLHVIERRDPRLEIVLAPCRVQGDGAAEEIAAAVRALNALNARASSPGGVRNSTGASAPLDLILVTRGGGSLEDLWAFNEEVVARAIFESALPVVSAVGHEIDFTISDFVADVRAATPSAAAEIITQGVVASRDFVTAAPVRFGALVRRRVAWLAEELAGLGQRLGRTHPRRRLNERWQHLDELQTALMRSNRFCLGVARARWESSAAAWARVRPTAVLDRRLTEVTEAQRRVSELARRRWEAAQQRLVAATERLRLLSPERVLARGYSITLDAETGQVLRASAGTRPGQRLRTRLHKGEIRSVVEE